MLSELLKVDVDTQALVSAMSRLTETAEERFLNPAARVTASRIAEEARRRVRRGATGQTAQGIRVEPAESGVGSVVLSQRQYMYNLPIWLEFGTKYAKAYPYFFAAVRVEEDAHDRRMRAAVQAAIDASGLGD